MFSLKVNLREREHEIEGVLLQKRKGMEKGRRGLWEVGQDQNVLYACVKSQ
jgi:hypothetical protein